MDFVLERSVELWCEVISKRFVVLTKQTVPVHLLKCVSEVEELKTIALESSACANRASADLPVLL